MKQIIKLVLLRFLQDNPGEPLPDISKNLQINCCDYQSGCLLFIFPLIGSNASFWFKCILLCRCISV